EACDVLTTQRSDVEASLARLRTQRSELLANDDVDRYVADLEARQQASRDHVTKQHTSLLDAEKNVLNAQQLRARNAEQLLDTQQQLALQSTDLHDALAARSDMTGIAATDLQQLDALIASLPNDLGKQQKAWQQREQALRDAQNTLRELDSKLATWRAQALSQQPPANVSAELDKFRGERDEALQALGALQGRLLQDDQRRAAATDQLAELAARMQEASRWAELSALIGSADGAKFKRYAQQFTLEVLIEYANAHLQRLAPRYRLRRGNEALSLLMIDTDLGDEVRSVHSLSGGETFLVSLALALGLASLSSQRVRVESLFIDEGFGSLDGDTLNMAMQALDRLQADGRRVGVISHVHDMAERIGVEIRVEAVAPGRSRVRVVS
ncbi:MAG: SbcC/MukB-like Walker B domain-containing protein, partial [Dokdonella sp.]